MQLEWTGLWGMPQKLQPEYNEDVAPRQRAEHKFHELALPNLADVYSNKHMYRFLPDFLKVSRTNPLLQWTHCENDMSTPSGLEWSKELIELTVVVDKPRLDILSLGSDELYMSNVSPLPIDSLETPSLFERLAGYRESVYKFD